jgi:hypothetical protein
MPTALIDRATHVTLLRNVLKLLNEKQTQHVTVQSNWMGIGAALRNFPGLFGVSGSDNNKAFLDCGTDLGEVFYSLHYLLPSLTRVQCSCDYFSWATVTVSPLPIWTFLALQFGGFKQGPPVMQSSNSSAIQRVTVEDASKSSFAAILASAPANAIVLLSPGVYRVKGASQLRNSLTIVGDCVYAEDVVLHFESDEDSLLVAPDDNHVARFERVSFSTGNRSADASAMLHCGDGNVRLVHCKCPSSDAHRQDLLLAKQNVPTLWSRDLPKLFVTDPTIVSVIVSGYSGCGKTTLIKTLRDCSPVTTSSADVQVRDNICRLGQKSYSLFELPVKKCATFASNPPPFKAPLCLLVVEPSSVTAAAIRGELTRAAAFSKACIVVVNKSDTASAGHACWSEIAGLVKQKVRLAVVSALHCGGLVSLECMLAKNLQLANVPIAAEKMNLVGAPELHASIVKAAQGSRIPLVSATGPVSNTFPSILCVDMSLKWEEYASYVGRTLSSQCASASSFPVLLLGVHKSGEFLADASFRSLRNCCLLFQIPYVGLVSVAKNVGFPSLLSLFESFSSKSVSVSFPLSSVNDIGFMSPLSGTFVWKKGGASKNTWQRRYFELDVASRMIKNYKEKKNSKEERNTIPLDARFSAYISASLPDEPANFRYTFLFDDGKGRVYSLAAESPEDRLRWICCLESLAPL